MNFDQFQKKQASVIDKELIKVLEDFSIDLNKTSPVLKKLFSKFIDCSRGGKRIRGVLVLLGYQIGGGKGFGSRIKYGTTATILDAAVAFEIFQTAILAQDDVIDKSLTRRGKASLYNSLGGDHKAVSETICLSDLGFFMAFRLINDLKIEDSRKIKALNLFSQTLTETVMGEILDIETPYFKGDFKSEHSLKISLLKTAQYTISGPLMLGMTLAWGDSKTLKSIKQFGDNLGIAFQIQDDILGIFGDEKVIGKSAASDIKECKATLLISYAQEKGNKQQRALLEKYYGNPAVTDKGLEIVREIFIKTGSLEYAEKQVVEYVSRALKILKGSALDPKYKQLLEELADFIINRQS